MTPVKIEFNRWLNRLVHSSPVFKSLQPCIKLCFEKLFYPALDYLKNVPTSYIYFRVSEKHFYFNFINIFEMLLNEFRKRDIALGLFKYSDLNTA